MKICWLSAGVSSAIAAIIARPELLIYQDIPDQERDSLRFVHDVADYLNTPVELWSTESVDFTCRRAGYLNGPQGPACSSRLKRNPRKAWERVNPGPHVYIWGIDCTEAHRAERIRQASPEHEHIFPLIDRSISKSTAHEMLASLGIRRPRMYDLGYENNNCIGCLRGGKGYWNKIRRDFPEVFESRAKLERDMKRRMINACALDDLSPDAGIEPEAPLGDCDLFCEIYRKELTP